MFNRIEEINADIHIIKSQTIGLDRQKSHLANLGAGDVSMQDLIRTKEIIESAVKSQMRDGKSDKTASVGYHIPGTQARD